MLPLNQRQEGGGVSDWNTAIIQEFRDNDGVVGGYFEGRTLLLLTSTGAKSDNLHTTPLACYRDGDAWVIHDVGSSNGTFVNGEKVTRRELKAGDEVRAGHTTFRVEDHYGGASG